MANNETVNSITRKADITYGTLLDILSISLNIRIVSFHNKSADLNFTSSCYELK
jgi:hypothetical protein